MKMLSAHEIKAKLEELKDMVDAAVEEYGQEVLDSSWVKYQLGEIETLEQFLASL